MNKIVDFLKDVRLELSRVSWPSREQTIKYSLVVIGISLFFALFFGGLDTGFTFLLNKFILKQ